VGNHTGSLQPCAGMGDRRLVLDDT
jgi:hypothetical protein